jgi:hypothetical protein
MSERSWAELRPNWKLVGGFVLVVLALYAFAQNIWRTTASEAYVNAALASVASPIPGRISAALPPLGSRVPAGFELRVEDERADLAPSVDIDNKLAETEAELANAELKIAATDKAQRDFRGYANEFGRAKSGFLEQRIAQAGALAEAQRATLDQAVDDLSRLQQLPERAVAVRDVIIAQTRVTAARNDLAAQQAEVQSLIISRDALGRGVQLTEGLPDRTYSDQRAQELALLLATEKAKRQGLMALRDTLRKSQQSSRQSLERRRDARIPVPDGVVWRRSPENSFVAAGGVLGAVAVCSEVVLTATLTRRDFQRVFVGQAVEAAVRIESGERIELQGKVIALTGPTIENAQGMAIPFGRSSSTDGYGVVVRPDDPAKLGCRIGAQAKLEFRSAAAGG